MILHVTSMQMLQMKMGHVLMLMLTMIVMEIVSMMLILMGYVMSRIIV